MPTEVKENWRQFRDTNYFISDEGNIKKKIKSGWRKITPYGDLKRCYVVRINGEKFNMSRVVWETFKGKIPDGYNVIHINGCKTMNDLYNLRLAKNDDMHYFANRRTKKPCMNIKTGKRYKSMADAGRDVGFSRSWVARMCHDRKDGWIELKKRSVE